MTMLAVYLLKVIVCSGILFLYYHLALRNKHFHQWNRFYLLLSTVLSLLLPLVQFELLSATEEAGNSLAWLQSLRTADQTLEAFMVARGPQMTLQEIGLTIYLTGCVVLLLFFVHSLMRIVWLIRSHTVHHFRHINFIQTKEPGAPFSFFDYIFWNPALSLQSPSGEKIFQHEMVHVREKHSYDKVYLLVLLVFFWCNPFFWLIKKEMHCIHEFIADRRAVGDKNASELAGLILQTVYPGHYSSLTNQFFHTSIKRRIAMLTKKENRVVNYITRLVALPLLAFVVFAFTIRTKTQVADRGDSLNSQNLQPEITAAADTVPRKEKDIASVDVDKNAKKVTVTYKDGSKEVLTQEQLKKRSAQPQQNNKLQGKDTTQKPLYIVDGKEFTGDVNKIDPKTIQSIHVLKGEHAADKYGEKGKTGVVEITLKKDAKSETQQDLDKAVDNAGKPAAANGKE